MHSRAQPAAILKVLKKIRALGCGLALAQTPFASYKLCVGFFYTSILERLEPIGSMPRQAMRSKGFAHTPRTWNDLCVQPFAPRNPIHLGAKQQL